MSRELAERYREKHVVIDYTNYRGERAERRILPMSMFWGTNEWHKTLQWIVVAYDLDKEVLREFAMSSVHSWKAADEV